MNFDEPKKSTLYEWIGRLIVEENIFLDEVNRLETKLLKKKQKIEKLMEELQAKNEKEDTITIPDPKIVLHTETIQTTPPPSGSSITLTTSSEPKKKKKNIDFDAERDKDIAYYVTTIEKYLDLLQKTVYKDEDANPPKFTF